MRARLAPQLIAGVRHMMMGLKPGTLAFTVAALLTAAAIWCFLWTASSSSLCFVRCHGSYSLWAEIPACREPAVASLLFWLSSGLALVLAILGFVQRRAIRKSGNLSA